LRHIERSRNACRSGQCRRITMTRLETKAIQQIRKLTDLQRDAMMWFEITHDKSNKEPSNELNHEKAL